MSPADGPREAAHVRRVQGMDASLRTLTTFVRRITGFSGVRYSLLAGFGVSGPGQF